MIQATVNEPIPLQVFATDGRTDLYGKIYVYDSAGTLLHTFNASHVVAGIYGVLWTPTSEGYFTIMADLFYDPNGLVSAGYERRVELLEVSATKTNIMRLLGLAYENSIIDQQAYNPQGQLVSARIRVYDSKATAALAGVAGLRFVYSVQADYNGPDLSSYKILREQ